MSTIMSEIDIRVGGLEGGCGNGGHDQLLDDPLARVLLLLHGLEQNSVTWNGSGCGRGKFK